LGHAHKKTTLNVLLKGKMAIIVNGQSKIIEGPFIFNSEPGRKFACAIEDCIFQNIHATDKTNLDEIERQEFIEKKRYLEKQELLLYEHFLAIDKAD
jgi:hypothetical protein